MVLEVSAKCEMTHTMICYVRSVIVILSHVLPSCHALYNTYTYSIVCGRLGEVYVETSGWLAG